MGMPSGDAQWGCPLGVPNTGSRRLPRENRDQRRKGADSCKVSDDDDDDDDRKVSLILSDTF